MRSERATWRSTSSSRAGHAPSSSDPQQSEWLKRLDLERENLLAAHAWSCEADLAERHGLQLVSSLRRYWIFRGLLALG